MKTHVQNLKDMSDSLEILESRPHSFTFVFVYILIAIIITALIWACIGKVEEYVKATGVIRPGENISTIRNIVPGRVKKVNVKEGARVAKGDILFTVETEILLVERNELAILLDKLERKRDNLLKLKRSIRENVNLFDRNCNEQAYFYNRFHKFQSDSRAAIEQSENALIDLRKMIAETELSKTISENRLKNAEETKLNQITLLKSAEKDKNLFEKDNIEYYGRFANYKFNLDKLTMAFNQKVSHYGRIKMLHEAGGMPRKKLEDAESQKEAANLEIAVFMNEFKTNLRESIKQNTQIVLEDSSTLKNLEERLVLLRKKRHGAELALESIRLDILIQIEDALNSNRLDIDKALNDLKAMEINLKKANIKAPIEGILHIVAGINSGDFLDSGKEIAMIIPEAGGEFEAQLMVANKDIANIKEGQKIKYRLLAYPFHKYGEFEGYVRSIGADARINPKLEGSYFLIEASIETQGRPRIRTGMACEARLVTRSRRVILWFLERINLLLKIESKAPLQ